jgi:membrane protein CcdC involved in cytochrome C biogenesis
MRSIPDLLSLAWTYKFSLMPVLLTYLIFELPALIRRYTRRAYIPIYFMFFPLGHSDQMYAQYFNEDDMYGVGESMTDAQKETLRTRIKVTAVASMIFAAVIAPWLCGFIAAFYLTQSEFFEFIWFLMILKTLLICTSLYAIKQSDSFVMRSHSFKFVVLIYIAYLFLIWRGVTKSFSWTFSNINANGFLGLLQELAEYAYMDVFLNIIVVGLGTWAITNHYLDPKLIREKHVYDNQESKWSEGTTA